MPASQPPRVERRPRRTSPKTELARGRAQLRDLLRHWSKAAAARGVSQKAIRTVRIASELGEEGWDAPDADSPTDTPLVAAAAFEPCTEMRCVALARYCLDRFAERGDLLWKYRRKELSRLHGLAELAEALTPEVEYARAAFARKEDLQGARHAENREMKTTIIAWDRAHGRCGSAESAAKRAEEGKLVPAKLRTIRDWILAGRHEDGFLPANGA